MHRNRILMVGRHAYAGDISVASKTPAGWCKMGRTCRRPLGSWYSGRKPFSTLPCQTLMNLGDSAVRPNDM